jgi:hypothetical protein
MNPSADDDYDVPDSPLVRPFLGTGRDRGDVLTEDDDVVRPFLLTNGRASGRSDLAYEAMVSLTPIGLRTKESLRFEARAICELCQQQPQAIAELAARLRIPIGSVRVLAGDLVADGVLDVHQGVTSLSTDVALLKRLIHGVRAL